MKIDIGGKSRAIGADPQTPLLRAPRDLHDTRGIPPRAPAPCNAILAATGARIRALPVGDPLAA